MSTSSQCAQITGAFVLSLLIVLSGCSGPQHTRTVAPPGTLPSRSSPYLKVHHRSGALSVLGGWKYHDTTRIITGTGVRYDAMRAIVHSGSDTIQLDSIALLETNSLDTKSPAVIGLAVLTGISLAVTIACIANPKACFGSCPTFYTANREGRSILMAEGFSSSIAPMLEETDVDPLFDAATEGQAFELRMTNEALETHVVRSVNLLSVARNADERVFATKGGRFLCVSSLSAPDLCHDSERDICDYVTSFDDVERTSAADSSSLATRETLSVRFDRPLPGRKGVVIGFRQSLMTTWIFYRVLSYLGSHAGEVIARCGDEASPVGDQLAAISKVLGGIEISARSTSGEWIDVGTISEQGPIARNLEVIELPEAFDSSAPLELRIVQTKGLWRLDQVALGTIEREATPVRLAPVAVARDGLVDTTSLAALLDSARTLVAMPGDVFAIRFALPPTVAQRELFVESRGYYLEWMREEWMAEENIPRASQIVLDPEGFFRAHAADFKLVESSMDEAFWRSRYENSD